MKEWSWLYLLYALGAFYPLMLLVLIGIREWKRVTKGPAVVLDEYFTAFLKDPCTKTGRAVLQELPRTVYRFSWYDATAGRVPCAGVSRFWSVSGAIWGVEEVKAYLRELKAQA